MTFVALLVGYLIGSVPTALWLGRLWGVDLRAGGTGNPGANNARRLGGLRLALLVLVVEMAKGIGAVAAGFAIGDDAAAVGAALGAIAGNVYNVWMGFRGGKGLGITSGVLVAAWPAMFPVALLVLALAAALTRSTGKGTLITLVALVAGALVWREIDRGGPWGVDVSSQPLLLAVGIGALLFRKHWADATRRIRSPAPH
ncbi:MAG: glycerol-3-phosphate acyltransferase [Acidimicrobiia bacterium]